MKKSVHYILLHIPLNATLAGYTARGVHGQALLSWKSTPRMEVRCHATTCHTKAVGFVCACATLASLLIAFIYLIAPLTTSLSPVNRMPFRSWSSLFILGPVYQSNRVVLSVRSWAQSFAESVVASSPVGTSVASDSPSFASCFSASLICSRVCSLSFSSFT